MQPNATITRMVPVKKMVQFQDLVKLHNLRFLNFKMPTRHDKYADNVNVVVTVAAYGDESLADFDQDWERMNMNIVEKVRSLPLWRRVINYVSR